MCLFCRFYRSLFILIPFPCILFYHQVVHLVDEEFYSSIKETGIFDAAIILFGHPVRYLGQVHGDHIPFLEACYVVRMCSIDIFHRCVDSRPARIICERTNTNKHQITTPRANDQRRTFIKRKINHEKNSTLREKYGFLFVAAFV